ncbi:RagB/SusD family nutrient uptake outer membrane protein [Labilibacter marinus]|uniref:RagB/SusD family nutrient uptake outer membrane protein n=1 Tax=Labilibacter marinus TaxID=1477105 RepID=UPI00094FB4BC|nr:RagB/SusD family nutrient uptake outer membrane protein [Labilibacter marinus]
MKYYSLFIFAILLLASCGEEFLDPKLSTKMTYEQLLTQPDKIEGLVVSVYSKSFPDRLDNTGGGFLDCGTDNAVINLETQNIYKIASIPGYLNPNTTIFGGTWGWGTYYESLRDLDMFFDIVEENDIVFKKSTERNDSIFKRNLFGEAYFLRAWTMASLLKNFGGVDDAGELKGVPIPVGDVDLNNYEELPRESYDVCLDYINEALDSAMVYLPLEWNDSDDIYTNRDQNFGRPTQVVAQALRSRVALYAASPAFTKGLSDDVKRTRYQAAAEASRVAIDLVGDLGDIYTDLEDFYCNAQNEELLYRRIEGANTSLRLEQQNFIPTLYGNGRTNPTQNLVDAFPMSDGYPAGESPTYDYNDDNSMYQNRDPRFYATVLYNGATVTYATSQTQIVETFVGGDDTQANPDFVNRSTKTSYYLRKWMSTVVNLRAGQQVKAFHYAVYFRKAEMYLNFAEAVNELAALGGPDNIGGLTAADAIGEVRDRALQLADDAYLTTIGGDVVALRDLIKNERRIELCFEGHRFYDLRRWEDKLDNFAGSMVIDNGVFTRESVYQLAYDPDNYYLPIHQNEMNKTTLITQNAGW